MKIIILVPTDEVDNKEVASASDQLSVFSGETKSVPNHLSNIMLQ